MFTLALRSVYVCTCIIIMRKLFYTSNTLTVHDFSILVMYCHNDCVNSVCNYMHACVYMYVLVIVCVCVYVCLCVYVLLHA